MLSARGAEVGAGAGEGVMLCGCGSEPLVPGAGCEVLRLQLSLAVPHTLFLWPAGPDSCCSLSLPGQDRCSSSSRGSTHEAMLDV